MIRRYRNDRRAFLLSTACVGLGLCNIDRVLAQVPDAVDEGKAPGDVAGEAAPAPPFDFDRLVDRVAEVAAREHEPRRVELEGDYANLDYDAYRDIRWRSERDPLGTGNSSFALDLLPPGFLFTTPVDIALVVDGVVRPLEFSLDDFDFGPLAPRPERAQGLHHSGFRVRHPINRPDVLDEVCVFQGASYFRAVARGQRYGLSARGLAVDTASEAGEEFPEFRRFWIEMPGVEADSIVVYALLDSPSVAGAYRFDIRPGEETVMQVRSVLFPRRDLDNVGVAPLTSMFLFDPSSSRAVDDYRPAVHDSDGLRMINGRGERILRSLANPSTLQISSFVDTDPVAFGLVQGSRDFADYEDAEARYELRPSAWVQPIGKWGAGRVELVEIPTDAEIHDNIAAFWRPDATLPAGQRQSFDYRLSWTHAPSDDVPLLRVREVRSGERPETGMRQFTVDFRGPDVASAAPRIELGTTRGQTLNVTGKRLEATGDFRVGFDFDPGDAPSSDIRLQLQGEAGPASETWLYRWTA